jgi:hypothetical protein
MKSPNEVKLAILEEFKREYRKAYKDIFDESILSQGNPWFEDFLSQSLDRLQASIVESLPPLTKTHTYSSENSEVYRAYENGQKDYYQEVLDLLTKEE